MENGGASSALVVAFTRRGWWGWVINPSHVTICFDNTAFLVGPDRCAEMPMIPYLGAVGIREELTQVITVPVPVDRVETVRLAVNAFCVGPMTRRDAIVRFLTGRRTPNIDCVYGACIALAAAGYPAPRIFRTPKGLLRWLQRQPKAVTHNSPSTAPPCSAITP